MQDEGGSERKKREEKYDIVSSERRWPGGFRAAREESPWRTTAMTVRKPCSFICSGEQGLRE